MIRKLKKIVISEISEAFNSVLELVVIWMPDYLNVLPSGQEN